jgi:hypothetical protein
MSVSLDYPVTEIKAVNDTSNNDIEIFAFIFLLYLN